MLAIVEKILKQSEKQQKSLLRFFARQHMQIRLELFEVHRSIFHRLRQEYQSSNASALSYCALIISIAILQKDEQAMQKKNFKDMSLDEIQKLSVKRIENFKLNKQRQKGQQEKVIAHWPLILSLKQQGLSYRDVSRYLKKYHKTEVSYSSIYSAWKELENEKK